MTAISRKGNKRPKRPPISWRALLEALPTMTEKELEAAIKAEANKPEEEKRQDVILRLHRRFCKVRQAREFQELLTINK